MYKHLMSKFVGKTDPVTSRRMAGVRRNATGPELFVRAHLRRLGMHYRCNCRGLPGSPDLANKKRKWAIFIHGCFWHGHPHCSRATTPKRNRSFWIEKIKANKLRDLRKEQELRAAGFDVLIVWECQIQRDGNIAAVDDFQNFLKCVS